MYPVVEILGKTFGSYALTALLGALLSGTVFCALIKKRGLDDNDAIIFLLFVALGVVLGGHLLYGIVNHRYFSTLLASESLSDAWRSLKLLFGGSVFYGGLLGAIAAGLTVIKVMRLNAQVYMDCIAPVAPLFHGIARIGCFLAGCCYGIRCDWGITVTGNTVVPGINGVARFPVQLLEAVGNFLISGLLFYLLRKAERTPKLRGRLLCIYFALYACLRFFDEFLRGDEARGFLGVLSTSQWISLGFFTCALLIMFRKGKRYSKRTRHT